jgi:hypothetical protein
VQDETWLDDEEPTRRTSRRVGLTVLAACPWLLVAALLLGPSWYGGSQEARPEQHEATDAADHERGGDGVIDGDVAETDDAGGADGAGGAEGELGGADGRSAAPEQAVSDAPHGAPGEDGMDQLQLEEMRGRWRLGPDVEEAASLGVVVARAALTGVEPPLEIEDVGPAPPDAYAEHLVVEAVERTERDATVVTVLAVVLEGEEELTTDVRRLAVPIRLEATGPRPAGAPWELPPPELAPRPAELDPLDDPTAELVAAEALERAGLDDLELLALHTTEGWPVVAEVRDPEDDATSTVWLRRHLDGFVVAGSTVVGSEPGSDEPGSDEPESAEPESDEPESDEPGSDEPEDAP